MTKINKLGKSTFVIAILSFILVAVLAFGGTYAYFHATSQADSSAITVGHLRISKDAKFDDTAIKVTQIAVPNQKIITADQGKVTVEVDSNIAYFIRAKITYKVDLVTEGCYHTGAELPEGVTQNCTCSDKDVEVLLITPGVVGTETAGWVAGLTEAEAATLNQTAGEGTYVKDVEANHTGWYYYNQAINAHDAEFAAGKTPNTKEHSFSITAQVNPLVGQVESEHFMDAVITVTVNFEVIQADYIVDNGEATAGTTLYSNAQLQLAWKKADTAIPTV